MSEVERAVSCFREGCSCAQAIFSCYGERGGLDREMALRLATPFGGGMGRMGETCGAVTGAFLALGLSLASPDPAEKQATYAAVRDFTERFKARNGSISCRELLGHDISTDEGLRIVKEEGLLTSRCEKYVRDAAEILEQMLL